ncbi:MAG: Pycsar system effector family protein [Chitinophagaceae bacterium]
MTPQDNNTVLLARDFVMALFQNKMSPAFRFHNLEHTQSVVKSCTEMADHYKLPEEERFSLILAAWFHDTGYSKVTTNHEEFSYAIAREFTERNNVNELIRDKIRACITATRMPQQPATLPEQIICDADLFHLGTEFFFDKAKSLRQELVLTGGKHISKEEWARTNIHFLETHRYFTSYCTERLDDIKIAHLRKLKRKYSVEEEPVPVKEVIHHNPSYEAGTNIQKDDDKKDRKMRIERPERGIETMFRTTGSNHLKLSEMADSKANIIISVNSIIISITISVLLEKLERYPQYIFPTTVLLLMSVLAIIFSILATRPHVTSGTFTKEDIDNKKTNLLFFGNFHKMNLEEYTWGMNELMNNRNYLYGSMIKDIYFLGVVLARKYRYLRISYNIFMFGLVIAVLAFCIASFLTPSSS